MREGKKTVRKDGVIFFAFRFAAFSFLGLLSLFLGRYDGCDPAEFMQK